VILSFFGDLRNAKPHKHAMSKGCLSSSTFLLYQTSLSHDGRMTRYPLVMSIANIACKIWYLDEGHVLLAILPVISST